MLKVSSYTFNPFQENTYIVYNEKGKAILIDPGMYFPAEVEKMEMDLLRQGLSVEMLINTHCHIDHIFSVEWAAKKFNIPLGIHLNEKKLLQFGKEMGANYGLNYTDYTGELYYLKEGDKVLLGDDELSVIEAPGHSPGSICLYSELYKFLIAGDVLFRQSIGRTDLPGGDHHQLIENIKTKLFNLPDDVVVYSGHGPSTTIGYEKLYNSFVKI